MNIKRVLILGSTELTAAGCRLLQDRYDLVGFVPSARPTRGGHITLPQVSLSKAPQHDIKISIQYDQMLNNVDDAYNLHTGLLPAYGGANILDYTLQNGEREQGLTFHKMTPQLDCGPIISKVTYPVLPGDRVVDLYRRVLSVGPEFLLASLSLLETLSVENVEACPVLEPTLYRRGGFKISSELKEYHHD